MNQTDGEPLPAPRDAAIRDSIAAIRFPIGLLTVACLLTIVAFAGLGWQLFDARRDGKAIADQRSRIEDLRGVIVHLDEVLTMSARLAATTGDTQWEERFRHFEPQLDAAIKETRDIGGGVSTLTAETTMDAANIKLEEMENRAFALIHAGRNEQARTILFGPEYEALKEVYAEGALSFTNQAKRGLDELARENERLDSLSFIAAVVVGGISFAAWLSAARGVRRWRFQLSDAFHRRSEAEENLRRAHGELEVRVNARTAELATANDSLRAENTERQRTEQALQESQARTKGIIQSSLDCIVTIDHHGMILEFNPAAEKVFGCSRANAVGMELAELIVPPSLRERHRQGLMRYLATGESRMLGKRIEIVAMRCDGAEFPVELAITRVGIEEPPTFTGFIRDISERKRSERQLHIQYAISRILAESSTLKQASARILQAVCENLKWSVGGFWEVHGRAGVMRSDDMWIAPGIDGDAFIAVSRATTFARGSGLAGRVWETARPLWISDVAVDLNFPRSAVVKEMGLHGAFGFPVLAGNEVVGVIEFFSHEVRKPDEELLNMFAVLGSQLGQFFERKRLQEQLIQSQKMETVGRLVGGIAHEFNSIMTVIIGQSELLLGGLAAGSPPAKSATEISIAANRAATLTRQLLAYSRRQVLRPEPLDLNRVLAGMEGMLRDVMGRGVDLRIVAAAGLKVVTADAGQIEQLIMNIAINARDAMPHGGRLTLETAAAALDERYVMRFPELKAGAYVTLAITDTGTGMSEDIKARIFDPFFTTKGVGQGSGLGLSTSFGIVKQSGGHIGVDSEPGRGTTLTIYLPQVEQLEEGPIQRLDSPDLPRGTETILLVEDDPAMREMAAIVLRRLGYTVVALTDGIQVLSLQQQRDNGHIDVLFIDAVVPHLSGEAFSERLRALYPRSRMLFTSTYTESAGVHQGGPGTAIALLHKPFTPGALVRKLREVLDQPQPSAQEPDLVR